MTEWTPPDLRQVTLYAIGERTENLTDVEILTQIGAQVISRAQFKWRESFAHLDGYFRQIAPVIEECHRRGMVYGGGVTCSAIYELTHDGERLLTREQFERMTCRDARGRIVHLNGQYYHGCLNNPEYVAYVDEYIRHIIDGGVDGIHFDEADSRWFNHQPGEGYCDHCEAGLREWLRGRYTPGQLRAQFGIEDLDRFHYRAYLAERDLADRPGESPVAAEWWLFQLTSCREKWQRWVRLSQEYAQERRGARLINTANVYDPLKLPERGLESPDLEYIMLGTCLEIEYRQAGELVRAYRLPPEHSYVPMYRMATAQTPSIPVTMFIDWPSGARYMKEQPVQVQKDIVRWCFAEAYASQVFFSGPFKSCSNLWTGPVDTLVQYGQFLRANERLFRDVGPVPQVAVLYSYLSSLWDYFPYAFARARGGASHNRQYYGVGEALVGANVQFQTVFAGDGQILPDDLTPEQLRRFAVLVVPWCYSLSDRQLSLLKEYAQAGGKLVVVGEVGTVDEQRNSRVGAAEELRGAGAALLGALDFESYLGSHDQATARALVDALPRAAVEVSAPRVSGILARSVDGCHLYCHLINRDWEASRSFAEKADIALRIAPPEGIRPGGRTAIWLSPDERRSASLPLQVGSGAIELTVPHLEVWGIAVIDLA